MSIKSDSTVLRQKLDINLFYDQCGVQICRTTRLPTELLLQNRHHTEALQIHNRLYTLCRQAQQMTAVTAMEYLTNTRPPRETDRARQYLVWVECLREHLWRLTDNILLGAPAFRSSRTEPTLATRTHWLRGFNRFFGHGQTRAVFESDGAGNRHSTNLPGHNANTIADHLDLRMLTADLFSTTATRWLSQSNRDCQKWLDSADGLLAVLLRQLTLLERRVNSGGGRSRVPGLNDGALARVPDLLHQVRLPPIAGLADVILARITETALLLAALGEQDSNALSQLEQRFNTCVRPTGSGNVSVSTQTARGRLTQHIGLSELQVSSWQSETPTDTLFSPAGPAWQMLTDVVRNHRPALPLAQAVCEFLDPCIAFELHETSAAASRSPDPDAAMAASLKTGVESAGRPEARAGADNGEPFCA